MTSPRATDREPLSKTKTGSRPKRAMALARKLAYACLAPIILLNSLGQPAGAIFNCLKLGKGPGQFAQSPYGVAGAGGVGHPGERANWYGTQPQLMGYPSYGLGGAGYGMSPMKMLFQPKLKSGSWFGAKSGAGSGWNNWRYAGGYPRPSYAGYLPMGSPTPGYQFSEQMQVAPFSLPSPINAYSSAIQSAAADAGWSVPVNQSPIQQQPLQQTSYETTSGGYNQQQAPIRQPLIDPYSIKGGNTLNPRLGGASSTTKKVLVANGAYGALDSFLSNLNNNNNYHPNNQLRNQTFGYAYPPNWYSVQQQQQQQHLVESPAKIAQQLLKYNLRRQRLQDLQGNLSAALVSQTDDAIKGAKFTILDEPRFVGFGTVEELNNSEARLSCSFSEAIDQTNRPVWVKFLGPYNSSQVINGKKQPPFNCANSQCRTQEVESTKDFRYKFDNGPATSTLIISEPRLSDYGIYRCSALTKTLNNNPLETIYQIIRFGSLK